MSIETKAHQRNILKDFYNAYWQDKVNEHICYNDPHPSLYIKARLKVACAFIKASKSASSVVVDLGCGPGTYLGEFSKMPFRTTVGIDISERVLRTARKTAPLARLMVASTEEIALKKSAADVVLCMHLMEHVVDDAKVFQEIRRILKPQGVALFQIPNGYSVFYWPKRIMRKFKTYFSHIPYDEERLISEHIGNKPHLRRYSLASFEKRLGRSGFQVVRRQGIFLDNGGRFPKLFNYLMRSNFWFSILSVISKVFPSSGAELTLLCRIDNERAD